jgi:hypothetical protein
LFLNRRTCVGFVATCALVPLGCSSSSSDGAGARSRCTNTQCDAAPAASDAGPESVEASLRADAVAPPQACVTGPGVTTLYEGTASTFAVGGGRVVIVGDSLLSVPLAGGGSKVLARPSEPQGLFVIGSTAYYQEWNPPGGVVVGGGGMPLMAVPTAGGALQVFLSALPAFTVSPGGTDGTSYYFTPMRGVGNVGGLSKLTPPSSTLAALTTERFLAFSIAAYGEDVYFIGTDTALTSSFIGRVPKRGGTAEHLVTDIGVPVRTLVVDESGLYWIQPLTRWADGIHRGGPYAVLHAGLDGSSVKQILADGPNSIAAAHGRLYFTTSSEVDSIAAAGGPVTTVAGNQNAPTMLAIGGGNLVWMNGFQGAPDGGITGSSGLDGSVRGLDGSTSGSRDGSISGEASLILGEGGGGPQPIRIVTACTSEARSDTPQPLVTPDGGKCGANQFLYDDMSCPPPGACRPDAGACGPCEQEGDLLCHARCRSDADCTDPARPRCGTLCLFAGYDYNGNGIGARICREPGTVDCSPAPTDLR